MRELPDFPRYSQIAILCKSCIVGAAKTSRSCGLTVTYEMLGSISSQWTVLQEIVQTGSPSDFGKSGSPVGVGWGP